MKSKSGSATLRPESPSCSNWEMTFKPRSGGGTHEKLNRVRFLKRPHVCLSVCISFRTMSFRSNSSASMHVITDHSTSSRSTTGGGLRAFGKPDPKSAVAESATAVPSAAPAAPAPPAVPVWTSRSDCFCFCFFCFFCECPCSLGDQDA